jgi:hypothetical protein
MKTTARMMRTPRSISAISSPVPPVRRIALPSNGSVEMTLAKMRIDMPLPTPRCVISSPSHMISAVPAVIVSTISATFGAVNVPCGNTLGNS